MSGTTDIDFLQQMRIANDNQDDIIKFIVNTYHSQGLYNYNNEITRELITYYFKRDIIL